VQACRAAFGRQRTIGRGDNEEARAIGLRQRPARCLLLFPQKLKEGEKVSKGFAAPCSARPVVVYILPCWHHDAEAQARDDKQSEGHTCMVRDEDMTVCGPQRLRCCCLAAVHPNISAAHRCEYGNVRAEHEHGPSEGRVANRACMCDGRLMPMLRSALTRGCDRPSAAQSSDA